AAWKKTLERLEASQQSWLDYLERLNTGSLNKIYPGNNMTYYEHIQGILQHDAYHLGQIVLLLKATG
ncbi:MAG TPA: DinB family protein, partial [Ferruginibacter sp.]|nr:DinB family protein [Ferruginibacter sp.]